MIVFEFVEEQMLRPKGIGINSFAAAAAFIIFYCFRNVYGNSIV
jgi:hypothetical protein